MRERDVRILDTNVIGRAVIRCKQPARYRNAMLAGCDRQPSGRRDALCSWLLQISRRFDRPRNDARVRKLLLPNGTRGRTQIEIAQISIQAIAGEVLK